MKKLFAVMMIALAYSAIASASQCWFCDADGSGTKSPTYVNLITQPFGFGNSTSEAAPLAMDQCHMLYQNNGTCKITSCYQAQWDYACELGGGDDFWCDQNPSASFCTEGNFCQLHPDNQVCNNPGNVSVFCQQNPSNPACKAK